MPLPTPLSDVSKMLLVILVFGLSSLRNCLVSSKENVSSRSYANTYRTSNYASDADARRNYDSQTYINHNYYGKQNNYPTTSYGNANLLSSIYSNLNSGTDNYGSGNNGASLSQSPVSDASSNSQHTQNYGSAVTGYYKNPASIAQDRFHPHAHVHSHEDDSHTGEVVLPPLQPAASQNVVSVFSPIGAQNSLFQSANSFSNFQTDSAPQASDINNVHVDPPSEFAATDIEATPPPLPGGYDYHPPPPPPPPSPAATPYYNYPPPAPPSIQYLPVPTHPPVPPSNQYLPSPTQPPALPSNHYLPAPTHPPAPPSVHYLPAQAEVEVPEEERQVGYSYYYLGAKLWYVPLFFSIYFVLYVGALIIKAVSKHKILFPQQLYNAATSVYQGREGRADGYSLDLLTDRVSRALSSRR